MMFRMVLAGMRSSSGPMVGRIAGDAAAGAAVPRKFSISKRTMRPPGPVPALENGANWILSSVNRTYEGGTCRIEREWMASGGGGWDEDIYGTGGTGA